MASISHFKACRMAAVLLAVLFTLSAFTPVMAASTASGSRVNYDQWASGVLGVTGSTLTPLPSDNNPGGQSSGTVVPHLADNGSTRLFNVEFEQAQFESSSNTPDDFASNAVARSRLDFNSPTRLTSQTVPDVPGMAGPFYQTNVTGGVWSNSGLQNILPVAGASFTNGQDGSYGGFNWPSAGWSFNLPSPISASVMPKKLFLYYKFTVSDAVADFYAIDRFQFGNNQSTTSSVPSPSSFNVSGSGLYLIKDPTFDVDVDTSSPLVFAQFNGNSFQPTGALSMIGVNTRGLWSGGASLNGAGLVLHTSLPSAGTYYLLRVFVAASNFPSYGSSLHFLDTMMALDASNGEYNWGNPGGASGTVSPMVVPMGESVGFSLMNSSGSLISIPDALGGKLESGNSVYDPWDDLGFSTFSKKEVLASNQIAYTIKRANPGGQLVDARLIYTFNPYGVEVYDELYNRREVFSYWQSDTLKNLTNNTAQIEQDANVAGKGLFASVSGFLSGLMQGLQDFLDMLTGAISAFTDTADKILHVFLDIPRNAISFVADLLSVFPGELTVVITSCFVMVLLFAAFKIFIGG